MATHRIAMQTQVDVQLVDTRDLGGPSRVNPDPSQQLRHWRVNVRIQSGVRIPTTVNFVARRHTSTITQADVDLGGNLFIWSWGIFGVGPPPLITFPIAGWSALPRVLFDDRQSGLWLMTCTRHGGNGSASIPLEVVQVPNV